MPEPDPQRQELAVTYARLQRRLFFLGMALEGAAIIALWPGGLSLRLAQALDLPYWAKAAAYLAVVMAGYGLLTLPLSYYGGLVLPRRFGLSTQGLKGWLSDRGKAAAVGMPLVLGATLLVYRLLVSLHDIWWLASAASAIVLSLVLTYLAPLVIVPLFFKMKPLADAELSQRLTRLADKARTRITGVYTLDLSRRGTAANAALMGLGRTRRIVLGDALLRSYTPDEIEVVMAHELGHHLGRHVIKLVAAQGIILLAGFYLAHLALEAATVPGSGFQGMADIAAFPVLALVLAGFMLLSGPLGNSYSRHLEAEADDRALALTARPEAFASLMTKLTDQNLSEARPSRWVEAMFYSHPPYWKRVERGVRYSQRWSGDRE